MPRSLGGSDGASIALAAVAGPVADGPTAVLVAGHLTAGEEPDGVA